MVKEVKPPSCSGLLLTCSKDLADPTHIQPLTTHGVGTWFNRFTTITKETQIEGKVRLLEPYHLVLKSKISVPKSNQSQRRTTSQFHGYDRIMLMSSTARSHCPLHLLPPTDNRPFRHSTMDATNRRAFRERTIAMVQSNENRINYKE